MNRYVVVFHMISRYQLGLSFIYLFICIGVTVLAKYALPEVSHSFQADNELRLQVKLNTENMSLSEVMNRIPYY